jgi:hypothetical protein
VLQEALRRLREGVERAPNIVVEDVDETWRWRLSQSHLGVAKGLEFGTGTCGAAAG